MDNLSYSYDTGNRLMKVADSAPTDQFGFRDDAVNNAPDTGNDYSYDANGNMVTDTNKGITKIEYNHLNLPTVVRITSDKGSGTGSISYIYDAMGNKLNKTLSTIIPGPSGQSKLVLTDYAGNFVYSNRYTSNQIFDPPPGELESFSQLEGYVERAGQGLRYIYQYKDHLGNVRLSYNGRRDYVLRSDFEDGMDGWGDKGYHVDRELEGGRMKVSVRNPYAGTSYALNQISTVPGEKYTISLTLDKATTQSAIRFYIEERDASGHLSYNMLSTDLASGQHSYEYTVKEGSFLIIRMDKDNSHTDQTTHFYLDDVSVNRARYDYVLRSDFEGDMDGWSDKEYNVERKISNGRMEASIIRAYSGTAYALYDVEAKAGEKYIINLELDKASTTSAIRLYVEERDASKRHLSYNMLTRDLPSGKHTYEYTVKKGSFLILRIDKDNTNTDRRTSFFLDNVSMRTTGESDLIIVEEKNYYPFGLEHKGYNNVVNGSENNYKQVQGQEFTEDLGLNIHEWKYRISDPAIGRFWQVDPLAEDFPHNGTYNFSENRVIDAIELEGLESYIVTGRSFIPQDKLSNLTPWGTSDFYKGDNRNYYSATSTKYRTEQSVRLNFDNNSSETLSNTASPTIGLDKNGSEVQRSSKGEAGTVSSNIEKGGVNLEFSATNKLSKSENPFTPSIDGQFDISITPNEDGTFDFNVDANVDGFPAYEIWVTDKTNGGSYLLFGRNPIESGEGPGSLYGNGEHSGSTSGNSETRRTENGKVKFDEKKNDF